LNKSVYSDFVVEIGILISSIVSNPNSYEDQKTVVPLTVARYLSSFTLVSVRGV
jgi:hypothetical protein